MPQLMVEAGFSERRTCRRPSGFGVRDKLVRDCRTQEAKPVNKKKDNLVIF